MKCVYKFFGVVPRRVYKRNVLALKRAKETILELKDASIRKDNTISELQNVVLAQKNEKVFNEPAKMEVGTCVINFADKIISTNIDLRFHKNMQKLHDQLKELWQTHGFNAESPIFKEKIRHFRLTNGWKFNSNLERSNYEYKYNGRIKSR